MFKTFVRGKEFRYSLIFISFIIFFTSYDIIVDLNEGVSLEHVLHEIAILAFSFFLIFLQLRSSVKKTVILDQMGQELRRVNIEKEEFKNKIANHSSAIAKAAEEQFVAWQLTFSEKEIAILLVKGLSMKEIATLRNSTEATVRQQAMGIYKKSKLENRQQLAAFFLEDLF